VGVAAGKWTPHGLAPDLASDQRQESGGSLVFDSQPLKQDFEILGAPILNLVISADRPNALIAAVLSDVQTDGAATLISYGVLNLTHRDSHEHPQPLTPGKKYHVKLQLNQIAHHFQPGHRIRLGLSSAYWPIVWPSPETVALEIDTTGSSLSLPVRPLHELDETLPEFGPVEFGSPLRCQRLSSPLHQWTVTTDLSTGKLSQTHLDESGICKINAYDWTFGNRVQRRYSIHPDDPLSAFCESETRQDFSRGRWRVHIDSKVSMKVTQDTFEIQAELHAYEGGEQVYSQSWSQQLPRDLV
jgi:hypothetical protein